MCMHISRNQPRTQKHWLMMASSSELSHEESGINLSDNDLLAREDNVTILVK